MNVTLADSPTLSVVLQVTVVVPIGNVAPDDFGVQVTTSWLVPSTGSTTCGVKVTTAPELLVAIALRFAWVIVGG